MAWKNVDMIMQTPQGQVIKDGKQPPPMPGATDQRDPFTIRTSLIDALPVMFPHENPAPSGTQKKRRYKLLTKLIAEKNAEIDFSDTELQTIREVADLAYGTMVYGIIEDWIDTHYEPAKTEKESDALPAEPANDAKAA